MTIRLGVLGLSDGNGHPYSWSAICNGYDRTAMKDCGFPVIPEYLAEQTWPEARLPGVRVTHVWTQDRKISEHIATASLIEKIVNRPEDMIGSVDGVLLARDDAENHIEFAHPFLSAGLPIYIDKPVALSLRNFDKLYALEQYKGQIFTCSAMRYAKELKLSDDQRKQTGDLHIVQAVIPKDWDRYGIHIIEPVLNNIGIARSPKVRALTTSGIDGRVLMVDFEGGPDVEFLTLGMETKGPLELKFYGNTGSETLRFHDTFNAFKMALADFVQGIATRSVGSDPAFNRRAIEILEMGRIS